jgi:hypothetical protein
MIYFLTKKSKSILKDGEKNEYEKSENENFFLESNQIPNECH